MVLFVVLDSLSQSYNYIASNFIISSLEVETWEKEFLRSFMRLRRLLYYKVRLPISSYNKVLDGASMQLLLYDIMLLY
jgi:hypothetical protein